MFTQCRTMYICTCLAPQPCTCKIVYLADVPRRQCCQAAAVTDQQLDLRELLQNALEPPTSVKRLAQPPEPQLETDKLPDAASPTEGAYSTTINISKSPCKLHMHASELPTAASRHPSPLTFTHCNKKHTSRVPVFAGYLGQVGPTADAVKEQAAPTAQAVKQQAAPAAEAVQSQAHQIGPDSPVQPGAASDSLVGSAQSAGQHNIRLLFGTAPVVFQNTSFA